MDQAIITNNLTKQFGSQLAVRELSLQVPVGSIYGFLGPNGAGKSTTLRLLLGLSFPTAGSARVLGMNPWQDGPQLRQQLGYVSENNNLYGQMTVREILAFAGALRPGWDRQLVTKLQDCFQLPQRETIATLSRGMQRQLALTIALAARPRLLLLDEPTSGLDPIRRKEFLNLLLEQMVEQEQTIFFSSHDLGEVERIADQVTLLDHGCALVQAPLDELKQRVRQVIVGFAAEAPELPDAPYLLRATRTGNRWELVIDYAAGLADILPPTATHVEEHSLSLEDIFVAYAGGKQHVQ